MKTTYLVTPALTFSCLFIITVEGTFLDVLDYKTLTFPLSSTAFILVVYLREVHLNWSGKKETK